MVGTLGEQHSQQRERHLSLRKVLVAPDGEREEVSCARVQGFDFIPKIMRSP